MSAAAYIILIKSSSNPIGVISFLKSPVELISKSTKIFLKEKIKTNARGFGSFLCQNKPINTP